MRLRRLSALLPLPHALRRYADTRQRDADGWRVAGAIAAAPLLLPPYASPYAHDMFCALPLLLYFRQRLCH